MPVGQRKCSQEELKGDESLVLRKISAIFGTKITVADICPLVTRDKIMNSVAKLPKSYAAHLVYVVLMPAFFISFCFLYNPFDVEAFYTVGGKSFAFHLLMLTCIMLGVYALTRLIFVALYKYIPFKWWEYGLWCVGEVLVCAFFMALYTALFYGREMPYFLALSHCLKFSYLILIYPYGLLTLIRLIINAVDEGNRAPQDEALVKLYDEHKRLKLTIDPAAILYISAEANYVKVHYLENERPKEFMLRNSMRSLEESAAKHGLVRCHRSYYVNPRHIKVLRKGKEGMIVAELLQEGLQPIPVSKQYYDALSDLL